MLTFSRFTHTKDFKEQILVFCNAVRLDFTLMLIIGHVLPKQYSFFTMEIHT